MKLTVLIFSILSFTFTGCGDEDPPAMGTAVIPAGLEQQWKLLPHRLSRLEIQLLAAPYRLATQNDGGPFGAVDRTTARLDHQTLTAPGLTVTHGEVKLEIPAGKTGASKQISVPLSGDGAAAPLLRGLLLSTNDYASPPAWKDRYDPAQGFTSAGLAVRLQQVNKAASALTFTVAVENRQAPCDRDDASKKDDMNGVIPMASSWITVAYSVVQIPGGAATSGTHSYAIKYPEFGVAAGAVSVPSLASRSFQMGGQPGLAHAVVGLQGFRFISNDSANPVAGCTDKRKTGTKGPGRYIRTLRARAVLTSLDSATGKAQVELDLMLANKAAATMGGVETGSMCVKAEADVTLLQLPASAALGGVRKTELKEIKSGERQTLAIAP